MYCSEVNFCVGTDEAAVIGLLTKRTNAQRQQIMVKFKLMYGKVRERDSGGSDLDLYSSLIVHSSCYS